MTIAFIHPIGLDNRFWDGVADRTAIRIELPGHGSSPAVEPMTFGRLVDHVTNELDGPTTLVGVSLGSMVAQHVAVSRPDMIRSLVLACGGMVTGPALHERADQARAGGMNAMLDSTLDRWFTKDALADSDHPGVLYARHRLTSDSAEVFAQYWDMMADHDLTEEIRTISVPTTVIAGDDDKSSPEATMKAMADRIANSRFRVIRGPHMLPLEDAKGFTEAIAEHTRWVESTP